MNRLLLAVDGGGSKTALSLRSEQGVELFSLETEGTNYHAIGATAFRTVMDDAIAALLPYCPNSFIDVGAFALAGVDTPDDEQEVRSMLEGMLADRGLTVRELLIENDAFATLKGLVKGEPGVLLISGTGAIAFAQDTEGRIVRAGGWGHRTGDGGGGRWMGMHVIDEVFRMEDGRGHTTSLYGKTLAALGMPSVDALCNWVNGPDFTGRAAARLTVQLAEAAAEGDETACRLVDWASDELVYMAEAAIRKSGLQDTPCTIYCNGGTLRNFQLLFEHVKGKLQTRYPGKQITRTEQLPIDIIAERALHMLRG